jgi:hypothetical protein
MRRLFLLAISLLLALPAAAQDSVRVAFPGIAWGVAADSVIARWGTPAKRWTEQGFDNLEFADDGEGRALTRFVAVHPELGAVMAGYRLSFGMDCAEQLQAARDDILRAYPGLEWDTSPPEPYDCVRRPVRSWINGTDPHSGTRVSIRMNRGTMEMFVDAVSREGYARLRAAP